MMINQTFELNLQHSHLEEPHVMNPHLGKPHLRTPHAQKALIMIQTKDLKQTLDTKMNTMIDAKIHTMTDIQNSHTHDNCPYQHHNTNTNMKHTSIADKPTNASGKPPTCMLDS